MEQYPNFLWGFFTLTTVFAKKNRPYWRFTASKVILGHIPKLRLWCCLFKRSHTEIHAILLRTEILLPDNLQKHTKTTLFKTNRELNTPSATCFLQKAEFFSMKVSRKKSIIHLGWRLFTHSFTSTTPNFFFAYFVDFAAKLPPKKRYITLVAPWK